MGESHVVFMTYGAYLVLLLGIGVWGDRRFGRSYGGFVAAEKSLGGPVSAVSSAASSESAWVILGLSGLGYARGFAVYWAALGCILGFALTAIFVIRQLRRDSEHLGVLTLADYLDRRLDDRWKVVRLVSSTIIVFFMLTYVVAQFVGAGKQVAGMELMKPIADLLPGWLKALGFTPYHFGVLLGGIIISIYVLIGGYAAVCWTDFVQGLIMMAVLVIFPIVGILQVDSEGFWRVLYDPRYGLWVGGDAMAWMAIGFAIGQLGIGLGYFGMPHSVLRFITVRNDREARRAAFITVGWSILVLLGSSSLGVIVRMIGLDLADQELALPVFTRLYFHPIVGGIVLAAVSAAIMSTADSQLMLAATSLVNDVWVRMFKADLSDRAKIIITRVIIGLMTLAAMAVALYQTPLIYTLVLFAWGALGAAFSPIVLLCLYWKRFQWQGALASLIVGPLVVIVWKLCDGETLNLLSEPLAQAVYGVLPGWLMYLCKTLYELVPAFAASLAAAIIVTLVTSPRPSLGMPQARP